MAAEDCLRRAMALAEQAHGRTAPNPMVGCVIVRDGQVVGEGWHAAAGRPHAEREALAQAGELARGAVLYCTLEPCSHHGRTPPCTAGIIAAGVSEVVYAVDDPDPRVAGRGAAQLRAAGLTVSGGCLAAEVSRQLAGYLHQRRTGRPLVTAKWAMTLDGKLATVTGDSRWVSGPAARAMVHRMRDEADAVVVGVGTVLADDPALTCRLAEFGPVARAPRNPLRVIVDTHGRIAPDARVLTDGEAATLWAVGDDAVVTAPPGVEVACLPVRDGRVDLAALLERLGARGVLEVLCEAGGTLTGALLAAGLVQRVVAVIAPKLVGGRGPTPWDAAGAQAMRDARSLGPVSVEQLGDDWVLRADVEGAD